jgi:1-acyl-sn-glycerol-3-phosphate acyltransferase
VRVEGRAPEPPFVLVSNHLSYLDILVLGTELRCVFVAKAEIDRWPVFGALCRSVATIFIDRRAKRELHRILAEMETTLAAGQGIVIFPEGTSSAGHDVLAFRSPLLDLPVRLGRPVHWATLGYRVPPGAPPAHLVVAWWADMPFGPHVRALLRLEWIEATLRLGGAPIAAEDRKHLAERLRAEVVARFEPMVAAGEVERLLALRESDPVALPAALAGGAGRRRGAPS